MTPPHKRWWPYWAPQSQPTSVEDPFVTTTRFSTLGGSFSVSDMMSDRDATAVQDGRSGQIAPKHAQVDVLDDRNFKEWFKTMKSVLHKLGLWRAIQRQHLGQLKPDEYDEDWLKGDVWTVNIILMHIDPAILARYELKRPITAYQLLEILRVGPKPFRLLDLPREIRDDIFRLALVNQPYKSPTRLPVFTTRNDFTLKNDVECPAKQIELGWEQCGPDDIEERRPALLRVNRQIREEASSIFWRENSFSMVFYTSSWADTPMKRLAAWARHMRTDDLNDIRDFTLRVYWYDDVATWVHLKYQPQTGLVAKADPDGEDMRRGLDPDDVELQERTREYCEAINKRREQERWRGNGIVEFFLDETAFKTTLWGPPTKLVDGPDQQVEVKCDPDDPDATWDSPW